MTEWNEFRNLDFEKLKSLMRRPILVDLRNVYESARVTQFDFCHVSVGRPTKYPTQPVLCLEDVVHPAECVNNDAGAYI